MSRAYRLSLRESVNRTITTSDEAKCTLDLLPILERGEMAEHLAEALVAEGFSRDGAAVTTTEGPVTTTVEVATGEVTCHVHHVEEVTTSGQATERVTEEEIHEAGGQSAIIESAREALRERLNRQADAIETDHQDQTTEALERCLPDLRVRLDRAVNRATAEALKVKASRLGRITRVTEDAETGQLEIVLEV